MFKNTTSFIFTAELCRPVPGFMKQYYVSKIKGKKKKAFNNNNIHNQLKLISTADLYII